MPESVSDSSSSLFSFLDNVNYSVLADTLDEAARWIRANARLARQAAKAGLIPFSGRTDATESRS